MHTSGSSCHTPEVDMIELEWLGMFYLMDVFHVFLQGHLCSSC